MSATTREVRTIFSGDASGMENAGRKVDRVYQQLSAAETKHRRKSEQMRRAQASLFRDITTGNGRGVLDRLPARYLAAGTAIGVMAAAAGKALSKIRGEMAATDAESRALTRSAEISSRRAQFSTAGAGASSLNAQRSTVYGQVQEERAHQSTLASVGEMEGSMRGARNGILGGVFDPGSRAAMAAIDAARAFMGELTTEEKRGLSEKRQLNLEKTDSSLRRKVAESYRNDLAEARGSGPGGDPIAAQIDALNVQREAALAAEQEVENNTENLALIEKIYAVRLKALRAQQTLSEGRNTNAWALSNTAGSSQSPFRKSLATNAHRRSQLGSELNLLDGPGKKAALLEMESLRQEGRGLVASRYLNADGTRRTGKEIADARRTESRGVRHTAEFNRRHDAGGFDPLTGQRVTGPGRWGARGTQHERNNVNVPDVFSRKSRATGWGAMGATGGFDAMRKDSAAPAGPKSQMTLDDVVSVLREIKLAFPQVTI